VLHIAIEGDYTGTKYPRTKGGGARDLKRMGQTSVLVQKKFGEFLLPLGCELLDGVGEGVG